MLTPVYLSLPALAGGELGAQVPEGAALDEEEETDTGDEEAEVGLEDGEVGLEDGAEVGAEVGGTVVGCEIVQFVVGSGIVTVMGSVGGS